MKKLRLFPDKNAYDMAYEKAYDILIELGMEENTEQFNYQLNLLTHILYIHISYLIAVFDIEIDVVN